MKRLLMMIASRAAFAGLLFATAGGSLAQDLDKPVLLIATPGLQGVYGHTALIALPLADKHFGFILNRPTDVTMARLYPDHAPSAKVEEPVYFGGPQLAHALFAVTARDPGQPSMHLFGDVYLTAQAQLIDRIIEETPNTARYYAGFVAWTPGELAEEVNAGYWYVADADPSLIFRHDTSSLWEDLVQRLRNAQHASLK